MMISLLAAAAPAGAAAAEGTAGAAGAVFGAVATASGLEVGVLWQAVSNTDTDIVAKPNLSFIASFLLSYDAPVIVVMIRVIRCTLLRNTRLRGTTKARRREERARKRQVRGGFTWQVKVCAFGEIASIALFLGFASSRLCCSS